MPTETLKGAEVAQLTWTQPNRPGGLEGYYAW